MGDFINNLTTNFVFVVVALGICLRDATSIDRSLVHRVIFFDQRMRKRRTREEGEQSGGAAVEVRLGSKSRRLYYMVRVYIYRYCTHAYIQLGQVDGEEEEEQQQQEPDKDDNGGYN